ncbi:MAG TPA: ion channel [Verrucomicrobiae bacterium]|nr:ion channel [Verrucomicrobiae bacterium]HTZ54710.1 ion channel [Candidatus Acidoferrum sp.]
MNSVSRPRRDWGEPVALVVALALFIGLRDRYILGGPILNLTFGVIVAFMCVLSIFWTITGNQKKTRTTTEVATGVFVLALLASTIQVVTMIVNHGEAIDAVRLIETALFIWIVNIIAFAIVYSLIEAEFAFIKPEASTEPINFFDCLYLSFTTSTAFSATDAPPLTTRARMLTILEAAISLTTISIVAARAVNILK